MRALPIAALICLPVLGHAQPPQPAIDACSNARIQSECRFNSPRGMVEGTCLRPPAQNQLVCVPRGMGNRPSANNGPPPRARTRRHTVTQSDGRLETVAANTPPITENRVTVSVSGDYRILNANGIARHLTGRFPNAGNPNSIREQRYRYRIPAYPRIAANPTPLGMHNFGLGVNGVPFDPGAAEWYLGDRGSGWQYNALSGAVALGLDENHAHVQPSGAYHYHGIPTLLLSELAFSSTSHSPLVGWAADGFPIYALYGYSDAESGNPAIIENTSSYRLKEGNRPAGGQNPGGHHDGTFMADYEFVAGAGTLDECNGRMTRTPEFPDGSYAYFLTRAFPIIPRCFRGSPSADFTAQRGQP